jgi:hypothetical protein
LVFSTAFLKVCLHLKKMIFLLRDKNCKCF